MISIPETFHPSFLPVSFFAQGFSFSFSFFSVPLPPSSSPLLLFCVNLILKARKTKERLPTRIVKSNTKGDIKNLSPKQLWTIAFFQGKDDEEMLEANCKSMVQELCSINRTKIRGKEIIFKEPCDMATQKADTLPWKDLLQVLSNP